MNPYEHFYDEQLKIRAKLMTKTALEPCSTSWSGGAAAAPRAGRCRRGLRVIDGGRS